MCREMYKLTLKTGRTVELPCRKCGQCRAYRVSNWVGKCLAESKTSVAVDFVTLTYCDTMSAYAGKFPEPVDPDHVKALHYEDVQKYIKRIRKAGHKVRYVVAGEYGEQKGRAHWHVLLFWQDARPDRNICGYNGHGRGEIYGNHWRDEFWHHGQVNYQPFTEEAARYVCKYLLSWDSDKDPNRRTKFRFSSRPGIGFQWLCDHWAQKHVERQLSPQDSRYTIVGATWKGVPIKFRMSPHAQTQFVKEFERRYYERWGDHPPPSPWMEHVLDKEARPLVSLALERRQHCKAPDQAPPNGEIVRFDQLLNSHYFELGNVDSGARGKVADAEREANPFRSLRFFWSFDPTTGERAWSRTFLAPSNAASLRTQWQGGSRDQYREASQAPALRRGPPLQSGSSQRTGSTGRV